MDVLMPARASLSSYVGRQWSRLRSKVLRSASADASSLALPDTLFATIGCQRSGTHLFREIVNSNPHLALLSEPFTPYPKSVQWCNYVHSLAASEFPARYRRDALSLLDEYMKFVRNDVEQDCNWYGGVKPQLSALGIDVKYNQLRCVSSLVHDLGAQPILLDFFRSRKFRIIHIVRKNVVQAALSMSIAMKTDTWQNYEGTEFRGRHRIPWDMLHGYILWFQSERAEFERLAQDMSLHTK
jgi:hypothetical protein